MAQQSRKPSITVVIANYNYEKFITRTIESVLTQTQPDVQCIVVDDGSTDASVVAIKALIKSGGKAADIQLIEKPNGGQVSALLMAIPHIKANITLFLDSDDYLHPEACAKLVKAYAPGTSMLQFKLMKVDPQGNKLGEYPDFKLQPENHQQSVLNYGFIPACPTSGNAFSTAHVRRMAETINPATEGRGWIDGYLIYSAPFTGSVQIIDDYLGYYLMHGNNVSMSGGRHFKSVYNTVSTAVWQRKGYLRLLLSNVTEIDYKAQRNLTPYHYRSALILRRGYPQQADVLPAYSNFGLAIKATCAYLRSPYIKLKAKLANIVVIWATLLAPAKLSRKLIPTRA